MHVDDSPAAELWRRTLSKIPTLFGRLVYLASLRDPNTGVYQHFGFAQRFSLREADKTLRRSHANTFADWLCFSLDQQKQDIDSYLAGLDGEKELIVANWAQFPPFASLVPAQTKEIERQLFLNDIGVILEILKSENSAVSLNPNASRRH